MKYSLFDINQRLDAETLCTVCKEVTVKKSFKAQHIVDLLHRGFPLGHYMDTLTDALGKLADKWKYAAKCDGCSPTEDV